MDVSIRQSKDSVNVSSKLHLDLKSNKYKTINSDACALIKSSPHFVNVKPKPVMPTAAAVADHEQRHRNGPCFEREKTAPEAINKNRASKEPAKRVQDQSKSNAMFHSRVASGLRPRETDPVSTSMMIERDDGNHRNEEKAAPVNESFTCGNIKRREMRSYSQISKACPNNKVKAKDSAKHGAGDNQTKPQMLNKSQTRHAEKLCYPEASHIKSGIPSEKENNNSKQADKIAVMVNVADSAKGKGFVVTASGSYINNININPVAYSTQPIEIPKESPAVQADTSQKGKKAEQRDSECVEIASKLEHELKKTVRESERSSSGGQNKFGIYRMFFDEITKADPYFGGLLREIQKAYESKFGDLNALVAKQGDSSDSRVNELKKELERERKNHEESEKQRMLVLKELKRQALYIENLKATIKELRSKRDATECSSKHLNSSGSSDRSKDLVNKTVQYPSKTLPKKDVPKMPVKNQSSSTRHDEKKHPVVVPKLDLSKLHSRAEDVNSDKASVNAEAKKSSSQLHNKDSEKGTVKEAFEEVMNETFGENDVIAQLDYHDEFMAMADEFSQSWKDALANEKRY